MKNKYKIFASYLMSLDGVILQLYIRDFRKNI